MASITITFLTPAQPPLLGYRIRYREVGTPNFNEIFVNGSPAIIPDLPYGKIWEGYIDSRCSTSVYSPGQYWTVNDGNANAYGISGRSNGSATISGADAIVRQATYYSPSETLAPGCPIYQNLGMTNLLTGYNFVSLFGQTWSINPNDG